MNDKNIQCSSCGRSWEIYRCPNRCSCGINLKEYDYTLPACIRNKKPECAKKAIIASTTVETTAQMEGIRDAFVHVTQNNTTYYLDSHGDAIITWAGPIEIPRYDVDNNPFGYKKQLLHTVKTTTNPVTGNDEDDDVVVYYDSRGEAHVLMTEDDITRMFEYIQNEEAQIWAAIDTKQDELTAGPNIIIDKDPDTGVVTISATGSGAAYTAGANIQISPYNVISATDTTYTAGQNINIDSNNVISAIVDLTNYYNKAEVNQLISDLDSISMRVVTTLPTTGVSNIIYLVQRTGETVYDQWVYSEGQWYHIGDTNIDLSEYYTKLEADAKFQELLSEGNNIDPVTDSTELSSVDLSNKVVDKVAVSDLWDYMWKKIYPVGSIYTTVTNDDPATLFGGTWEIVGANRVLWGVGSGDTAGTTLAEQLPNIKGHIDCSDGMNGFLTSYGGSRSGALNRHNRTSTNELWFSQDSKVSPAANGWANGIEFNAANSSSVYTDNGVVRPSAYTVKFWRRTA